MTEDVSTTDAGTLLEAETLQSLLTISRPRFWFYLAGPVLVGAAYGASTVPDLFTLPAVALFAYFLLPANLFLYGVNDVFDRDVDAENPKKTAPDARETRYQGDPTILVAVVLAVACLAPVLAVVPTTVWPWLAAWVFLATNYSAPPLRFKTTPLLDSLSNGFYVLPGVAAYTVLAGSAPPALAILGGWLWTMGMHTFSAIPDIEPDRHAGIHTTATWLGHRRSFGYCATVWMLAAVSFAALDWRLGLPLLAYPLLAFGVQHSSVPVDRAYWWFPFVNTAVGALLTTGGLWRLIYG